MRLVVLAPVLVLGIGVAAWVFTNTTHDMAHNDADSGAYIGKADQIRSGQGPTAPSTYRFDHYSPREAVALDGRVPSTHFPPGYPIALAAVSSITGDTLSAARAVNVICAFTNVLLLGLLAARLTGFRSMAAAVAPVVLVLFAPDMQLLDGLGWLPLHLTVYSEPLFTVVATGALLVTGDALTRPSPRLRMVLAAGALCAAALLTRYSGVAIILTAGIGVACMGPARSRGRRARDLVVIGLTATLPALCFQLWSAAHGAAAARSIAYHPLPEKPLVERVGRFFVPFWWPDHVVWVSAAAIVLVLVVAAFWTPERAREWWADQEVDQVLYRLSVTYVAAYLVLLWFTATFIDFNTRYDARLLAPARGVAYAAAVAVAYRWLVPYVRIIAVSALLGLLIAARVHVDWTNQQYGVNFARRPTRPPSPTLEMLADVPSDALIVTNHPSLVYLAAGRRSLIVPQRKDFLTHEPNPAFAQELAEWGQILRERGGYALFIQEWTHSATAGELDRHVSLRLISRTGKEFLYRIDPKGSGG